MSDSSTARNTSNPSTSGRNARRDSHFVTIQRNNDENSTSNQKTSEESDIQEIVWEDVIGVPESARHPECAWRLSNLCFRYTRNCCYAVLSMIFAPPCSLLLGLGFACLAFEQIWCVKCLRWIKICLAFIRTIVQSIMAATVAPTCAALGYLFKHISVNWTNSLIDELDILDV